MFVHGNADRTINWDSPIDGTAEGFLPPKRSVYKEFRERGYNDCELFGVTYLSRDEQEDPAGNYHRPEKYLIVQKFIGAVKAYTGKSQVDLVTHSLGVSMSLAALTHYQSWGSVSRFVNIAGGIRGLNSCLFVGFANPAAPTCGSENLFESDVFGFYPALNSFTEAGSEHSLREAPLHHPSVTFYTVSAGLQDEVHCTTIQGRDECESGALFTKSDNVKAQLNVGAGSPASKIDWNFSDGALWNLRGGDTDGIGHFKAKNNTGQILYTILNTDCHGVACKGDYSGGPVTEAGD